jgi:hypothetical protein
MRRAEPRRQISTLLRERSSAALVAAFAGALALVLLAPAEASAQFGGTGFGTSSRGGTAVMGTVQGSVADLDFTQGLVTIRTARGDVTMRAHPADLRGLNPGDVAAMEFYDYDGEQWLRPGGASGRRTRTLSSTRDFSLSGELTGTIESVDRQTGHIIVEGHLVRAHPEDVSGLQPGQFARIRYFEVEGERWAEVRGRGISTSGVRGGGTTGLTGGTGGTGDMGGIP